MSNYSEICDHRNVARIDTKFVKCKDCGDSFVSNITTTKNKVAADFTCTSNCGLKNFDRNFSNNVSTDCKQNPIVNYYADKNGVNLIKLDACNKFGSNPPKYQITLNGESTYLDMSKINEIIKETKAMQIDAETYEEIAAAKDLGD